MDEIYETEEGAPYRESFDAMRGLVDAYNSRDWASMLGRLADDFTLTDHRPAGSGRVDRDTFSRLVLGLVDLSADVHIELVACDAHVGAALIRSVGTAVTGGLIELSFAATMTVRDGVFAALEYFPPEHLSVLGGAAERHAGGLAQTFVDAINARDWEAVGDILADDVWLEDRRRLMQGVGRGRDRALNTYRYIMGTRVEVKVTIAATRGSRLALFETLVRGEARDVEFVSENFSLLEFDGDDRLARHIIFDVEDRAAAFEELDDRYEIGEGAPFVERFRVWRTGMDAVNTHDWERLLGALHQEFVLVDHLPTGVGTIDRGTWVELQRSRARLDPDVRAETVAYHRVGADAMVIEVRMSGSGLAGGPTERANHLVCVFANGVPARLERFPLDQLDAAIRRFGELTGPTAAPDGDAGVLDTALVRLGQADGFSEPIAVRGERLALFRVRDGERVALLEADNDLVITDTVLLDVADIDAAFEEMHRRYRNGDGAIYPEALELARTVIARVNERDWDGLAEIFADDFVLVDHVPTGLGDATAAEWIERQRAMVELAPDTRMEIPTFCRLHERGATAHTVALLRRTGSHYGGGLTDTSVLIVSAQRDGKYIRYERFPPDDLEAASARFDELVTGPGAIDDLLINAASRLALDPRMMLERLRDDIVVHDRRAGSRTTLSGRDVVLRGLDEWRDVGLRHWHPELIATRGDRLMLGRVTRQRPAGREGDEAEVSYLVVFETDAAGRIAEYVMIDTSDLDSAYAELDDRFATGEGAPYAPIPRATAHVLGCINAHDWAGMEPLFADDFQAIDHRQAGFHLTDRAGFIERQRAMAELAPDTRLDVAAYIRVNDVLPAALSFIRRTGSRLGGGVSDTSVLSICVMRDGRFTRFEQFSADQLDAALARFDQLVDEVGDTPGTQIANAVTRLYEGVGGPDWVAHNWDGFVAVHADDVVVEARTKEGLRYQVTGRDAAMAEARSLSDVGLRDLTMQPLAVRGRHLALIRWVNTGDHADHGGGPADVEQLAVTQVDASGHVEMVVIFEPDDIHAAMVELGARHVALEGPLVAQHPLVWAWGGAQAARDWDALRAVLAAEFVSVDHRGMGWGVIDRETFLAMMRSLTEVAPSMSAIGARIFRQEPTGTVMLQTAFGPGLGDAEFEMQLIGVIVHDEGHVTRFELFPVDQLEAALARFDELTTEEASLVGTTFVRLMDLDAARARADAAGANQESPFVAAIRAIEVAVNSGDVNAIADCYDGAFIAADHVHHTAMNKAEYVDSAAPRGTDARDPALLYACRGSGQSSWRWPCPLRISCRSAHGGLGRRRRRREHDARHLSRERAISLPTNRALPRRRPARGPRPSRAALRRRRGRRRRASG